MTKLKKYLQDKNISKEQLASTSGVPFTTLQPIVDFDRNPTRKTINKILNALNCKYEDIF